MTPDEADAEIRKLRAYAVSQASRIRELEDALARCVADRKVELREVLAYYSDIDRPAWPGTGET